MSRDSHMDAVRAVAFHATEPLLVSGSEDNTLKIWRLDTTSRHVASMHLLWHVNQCSTPLYDVEPIVTYRGHKYATSHDMTSHPSLCAGAGCLLWPQPTTVCTRPGWTATSVRTSYYTIT